jgi:hypothetical protein
MKSRFLCRRQDKTGFFLDRNLNAMKLFFSSPFSVALKFSCIVFRPRYNKTLGGRRGIPGPPKDSASVCRRESNTIVLVEQEGRTNVYLALWITLWTL